MTARATYDHRPSIVSSLGVRHFIEPTVEPYRALCGFHMRKGRVVWPDEWSGCRRICASCSSIEQRRATSKATSKATSA